MSDDRKPHFRFNPNAYNPGRVFEKSDEICEVCDRPCEWKYTGSIYDQKNPVSCASCIADGSLERFADSKWFGLHDISMEEADPELEREVMCRTPGVACFNPYDWPVIEGVPLAFLMYGDEDSELWNDLSVREEVKRAFGDSPWDGKKPGAYVLLFKQIDGHEYRAVVDPD